ncbi:MAG: Tn3 family transposase [Halieaceae bacterium]|jgi:TnpA family transposase|nr:Tn3 family transposase [Halieaceae bacterium]
MSESSSANSEEILPQSERLQALSPEEYELLWGQPVFSDSDRDLFFQLNSHEQQFLGQLRTVRTKAHFLLQLGYFRARQRFFPLDLAPVVDDLDHLSNRYLDGAAISTLNISKHTRQQQLEWILEHFGFQSMSPAIRRDLEARALRTVRISGRPLYIMRDLVDFLRRERVVLPGYTTLQDIVRSALTIERQRLSSVLERTISAEEEALLNGVFASTDGLHAVTALKHDPKDFSHKQLNMEVTRGKRLRPLFSLAQRVIKQTKLTPESVRFYASLVDYYTVYKLKRMAESTSRLYILCFIHDRYRRLNDHLLNAHCALIRRYAEEVTEATKESILGQRQEVSGDIDQGVDVLQLFLDPNIDDDLSFGNVRRIAFKKLSPARLARLCEHLSRDGAIDERVLEWQAIDHIMPKVKRNLRPLLRFLNLSGTRSQATLVSALNKMAASFRSGRQVPQGMPLSIIPERQRRHILNSDGSLNRNRYEYLVYRQFRDRLEGGDIFCTESTRYRSLEDDLVDAKVLENKSVLLPELGLVEASSPIKAQLDQLRDTLGSRYEEVNNRIKAGANPYVQVRKGRLVWSRSVDGPDPGEHEPLFDAADRIDIDQLLLQVDRRTRFLSAFEHVMGRYQRGRANKPLLVAGLMAYATNMGLGRMAEISNFTRDQLSTSTANFVRLETLREANDRLADATAKLPIFRYFDIGEIVHSSSDGQKFETAIPTVNSRHSAKYFGLKKGVVGYTMLASHVPLSARIIGANEHESHYVFDVLFNNTSDIQPSMHSTDTHGANQVNFALLHFFGYRFAPRYRDFKHKIETGLYGFDNPRSVEGPLKPVRRVRDDLMITEWPNIEQILLSLAMKSTSQSVIVSKLSTYRRQNRTKQALWEFDRIIQSLYLLDYIDSPILRRNVHRALNRGEAYHRLRRAIAYANGGRFRVRSQNEQEIWNECARLIANAVVHYNAMLLSEMVKIFEKQKDSESLKNLDKISPLAWQHVNFYGRYQFDRALESLNFAQMASQITASGALPWRNQG